jgi:hypothetical protein
MNRSYRRALARHQSRMKKHLGWIADNFLQLLFEENGYTYRMLYKVFSRLWQLWARRFNTMRARLLKADEYWFYDNYKPLEGKV